MPKYLKELPPSNKGKYERGPNAEHVKIVKALMKKPGEWLPVRTFQSPQAASSFARKIRENHYIAFKDASYEAKSQNKIVYARLVS